MTRISLTTVLMVTLFVGSGLLLWEAGDGQVVDRFNGKPGLESDMVVLKGSGQNMFDSHLYVEVEKNVPLSHASMQVATVNSDTGPWISEPSIDAGLDGSNEWKFSGSGFMFYRGPPQGKYTRK